MENIRVSLFGKTSPERSAVIMGATLEPCSKRSQRPIFQCLQVENGRPLEWFEGGQFVPLGDNLTLNIGECPSEESVSTLSEVLEVIVPKKYYLSVTACAGILRRAERRGKELPLLLKEALMSVVNASTQEETEATGVAPTMTGDHNGQINDYCAVVVQANGFNGQNSITAANVEMRKELSPTITCKKQADVLYAVGFLDCASAESYSIGYEEEKSPTLRASIIPSVIVQTVVFDETQITSPQNGCNPKLNAPCHPLAAKGKPPVLCIQGKSIGRADKNAPNGSGINEEVSFTLNTVDQHAGVYACDRASFNQGKNALYDFDINDSGINSTLVAKGPSAVAYKFIEWVIRRLTPLECERLQGYPDDWTKLPKIDDMTEEEFSFFLQIFLLDKAARGKKTRAPTKASLVKWYNKLDCDGNRYKMCGNSLAIPCALRVLGGIAENGAFNNECR